VQGKKKFEGKIYYQINLDSLVPEDHLLKRLDSLVSFEFVRNMTKKYYSHTGKPSIDPVVLVKMLLVGYLFNIRSERKLVEDISLNLAYRWYIGYDLDEEVPNHSIFSKARARFGKKLFKEIFSEILKLAAGKGLVKTKEMLIDSTIVKANASLASLVEVDLSPEQYWRELDQNEKKSSTRGSKPKNGLSQQVGKHFTGKPDKARIGKRRRNRNASYLKKRSLTDPDATLFYRLGMGNFLSYKAHVGSSLEGFITAIYASPSWVHDTGGVPPLVEAHEKILGTPTAVAADTKYGSEECLKYLQDKGIKTSIKPEEKNNRPGYIPKAEFRYDSQKDCYICPQGKILKRKTKSYSQNRIFYRASKKDCMNCPQKSKCISGKANARIVSHYDSNCFSSAKNFYYSKYGRYLQKLRSTTIEGIMGQAKEYHGMRRAKLRGLDKVEIQLFLTATAINLKKILKLGGSNPPFNSPGNNFYNFLGFMISNIKKLEFDFITLGA
jgi:transposase